MGLKHIGPMIGKIVDDIKKRSEETFGRLLDRAEEDGKSPEKPVQWAWTGEDQSKRKGRKKKSKYKF